MREEELLSLLITGELPLIVREVEEFLFVIIFLFELLSTTFRSTTLLLLTLVLLLLEITVLSLTLPMVVTLSLWTGEFTFFLILTISLLIISLVTGFLIALTTASLGFLLKTTGSGRIGLLTSTTLLFAGKGDVLYLTSLL